MNNLNELTEFWLEEISEFSELPTSPPLYPETLNEADITKILLNTNSKALTLIEENLTEDIELIFKEQQPFYESNDSSAQNTPRTSPTPETIETPSNKHKRINNSTTFSNKKQKEIIDFTSWKFMTCREQFPPPTQAFHYILQRAELVFFIIIESSLLLPGITLKTSDLLEALNAFGVKIKSVNTVKQSTLVPLIEAQIIEDLIDGKVILKPDFIEKLCNIKSNDSNLQKPFWYIYVDGWTRATNKMTTLYPHSELAKKIAQYPILRPKNTKEIASGGEEEHQENSALEQYNNITLKNSNANSVSIVIAALKNSSEPPPKFQPSVSRKESCHSNQISFFNHQEITAELCNFLQTCNTINSYLHKTTNLDEQIFYYILAIFFLVENHLIVRYGKKTFELSKSFIKGRCEEQFQCIANQLDSIINASLALLCDYGVLIFNKLSIDSYQLQENYPRYFENIPGHASRFSKNTLNAAGLKRIICSEYEIFKDEPCLNPQVTYLNFSN